MKVTAAFFRERRREICLYIVLIGTFALVSYLYNVRMDAVEYAFLLSAVCLLISGVLDYIHFVQGHKRRLETEQRVGAGVLNMADPKTLLEEDYQRIIEKMDEARFEAESAGRISRQEMLDYYSMWVHQIKTPIAAMHVLLQAIDSSGYEDEAGICEDEVCEDAACENENIISVQQYTKTMKMELFKIEQYVEMVLTYLRMEDMTSDLSFEICSLDSIIRQAVRKYSQMFILKKIKLEYTPVEIKVLTDEKWLVFVLEQILSNALKYTLPDKVRPPERASITGCPEGYTLPDKVRPPERASITGCISIYMGDYFYTEQEESFGDDNGKYRNATAEKRKKAFCLVIEDNGMGIWPEDLPRVFEKGFTGYNGRTDKKSTGIGLYLCKSIMDKLRHQIWIESEAGKGTKVYLSLTRETIQHE